MIAKPQVLVRIRPKTKSALSYERDCGAARPSGKSEKDMGVDHEITGFFKTLSPLDSFLILPRPREEENSCSGIPEGKLVRIN